MSLNDDDRFRSLKTSTVNMDFSPINWNHYFENKQYITCEMGKFSIYLSGNKGPFLILIHGAGFSALSWAVFTKAIVEMVDVRIIAIDLRCHGDSVKGNNYILDIETLTKDCVKIVESVCDDECKKCIIGHSLGGCIATHLVNKLKNIYGLVVIDVVEGTAKLSLNIMKSILDSRPNKFSSIYEAIEYIFKSKITLNIESAKVSGVGQMKVVDKEGDVNVIDSFYEKCTASKDVTWRIDLCHSHPYWNSWFNGLSKMFLDAKCAKLLVLTADNKLDRELLIGQMAGAYQLEIIRSSGHNIHEDEPIKLAEMVTRFIKRNRII